VEADPRQLLAFLEEQRAKQAPHFPTVVFDKVLSFMGTTSLAGTHAAVAVCPVLGLEPVGEKELKVLLRGPLPRVPTRGECLSVHLTHVERYQGFQVKTSPIVAGDASALYETRGDELSVHGKQIFTVHHSPYTMKFFEQIPFEEVRETVGAVRYALVAVGEQANLSPRFIFHADAQQGRLVLYHGDGLALKTYMNLKTNRQETRLVLDLDDFSGYALRGTVEEFQPHQHPEAYEKICQGFSAGSWGKPSRAFRFTADSWERIAPTGPAVKKAAVG
jgi:hypothetical protein